MSGRWRTRNKFMKTFSIPELRGTRENVTAEIQSNPNLTDKWKAALLETVADFMPDFNGVRIDAHAHQMESRVPLPLSEVIKNKDKDAPTERVTGGLINISISLSAINLSNGVAGQ